MDTSNCRIRSSAEVISGNIDLLTEVLLCLPIILLLRFKSVSKHWLATINDPNFTLRLKNNPKPVGLYVQSLSNRLPEIKFLPFSGEKDPTNPYFKPLIRIKQSCNGLFLCSSLPAHETKMYYYVYNPTTNRFTVLPDPSCEDFRIMRGVPTVISVKLAFGPVKSPHYKVVCFYYSSSLPDHYEVEIYSSETGVWKVSENRIPAIGIFDDCVFCNGSLHGIFPWGGDSFYYNIEQEKLIQMPKPPMPENWEDMRRTRYFGASHDCIHLIEIYNIPTTHFSVYEMKGDYSGWFVKYNVDLDLVVEAFPEMVSNQLSPTDLNYFRFVILGLVREGDDGNSFLVLHISGKAIRYNFKDGSFSKLCDFSPRDPDGYLQYKGWFDAFEYFESLASV